MGISLRFVIFLLVAIAPPLWSSHVRAEESGERVESFKPRPLDGVLIDAVETYINPKSSQLTFDLGFWPFNAYYTGFSLNVGYTKYFNKTIAWEVLNGSYLYSVDKNLTSQLAETYGVNPEQIERLNFALSSSLIYVHSYGKFIFLKEYIRYFRSGFLGGLGLLATNKKSDVAIGLGWRFEVYVNDSVSWKLELRDLIALNNDFTNNAAFTLGAAIGF
jgi:outer membrane beta-barrel protein